MPHPFALFAKGWDSTNPKFACHPEQQKSRVILSEVGRRGSSGWRGPRVEGPAVAFAFAFHTIAVEREPALLLPIPCFSVSRPGFSQAANRPPISSRNKVRGEAAPRIARNPAIAHHAASTRANITRCRLQGTYPRSSVESGVLPDLTIQQRSRKSGLLVIFTPISKLRDFIVRRLPKQNRQIEEGPRQLPIRSSGKRACGASACLEESSGA